MIFVYRLPIYKLLFIYVVAILLGRYVHYSIYVTLPVGLLLLLLSFLVYGRSVWFYNIIILLSLFFLFLSYFYYRVDYKDRDELSNYSSNIKSFYGTVISYPKKRLIDSKYIDCKKVLRKKAFTRQEYLVEIKEARFNDGAQYVYGIILVKSRYIIDDLGLGDIVLVYSRSYSTKNISSCADFDYGRYLIDRGISYISYPYKREDLILVDKNDLNIFSLWAKEAHDYLDSLYSSTLISEDSKLIKAMILGDREALSSTIIDSFKESGVMHILAISGLHIGMISLAFYIVLSIFGFAKRYIFIIVGIILVFYLFVVGIRPSILRAVIMYWCFALVFIFDRDRHFYNSLLLAAFISLLLYPLSLFHLGFQLSFLATLGILLYYSRIEKTLLVLLGYNWLNGHGVLIRWFKTCIKYIVSLLSITVSAQVLILPLIIYYFKGFSLISFASNVFIVVLAQLLVALAFILPVVFTSSFFSDIYAANIGFISQAIISLSRYFSSFSFSYIEIHFSKVGVYLFLLVYYSIIFILFNRSYLKSILYKGRSE